MTLYNPRTPWEVHFKAARSGIIEPLTSVGRATVMRLEFNVDADAIRIRAEWWMERKWPIWPGGREPDEGANL